MGPSSRTALSALRRLRRPALVCCGALVAALTVSTPASAHQVSVGDSYVVPLTAITSKTVDLVYTCDVDDDGKPRDCTPQKASTPGTEAAALQLTWSFTGAAEGAVVTLDNPLPAACGGKRGVLLGVASTGGTGTAHLRMSVEERNGLTGTATEQVLVDETKLISSTGSGLRRVLCFP